MERVISYIFVPYINQPIYVNRASISLWSNTCHRDPVTIGLVLLLV